MATFRDSYITENTIKVYKDLQLVNEVNSSIYEELKRQRKLYGIQRLPNNDWLPILTEEIGEVAECLQKNTKAAKDTDADDLYIELTQVAAVAISWAAQLKEGR